MNALLDNRPLHLVELDVDQYHRMLQAGVVDEGAPIELLNGLLVFKGRRDNGDVPITSEPHVYVDVDGCELPLVQITVDQMYEMVRAGIIEEGSPIELIDGLLVYKDRSGHGEDFMTVSSQHAFSPQHALAIKLLLRQLNRLLAGPPVHLISQQPVTLLENQQPEPDVTVVAGREEDYGEHHPGPTDVVLIVEVADSSLSADRRRKLELYAQASIPQYWIVNLRNQSIEVYTQPLVDEQTYLSLAVFRSGVMLPFVVAGQPFELDPALLFPSQPTSDH